MDGTQAKTAPVRRILGVALGFAGCLWALWFLLMCCRYDATDKFPLVLKGAAAAVGVIVAVVYLRLGKRLPRLVSSYWCTWLAVVVEAAGFLGLGMGLRYSIGAVLVVSYGLCNAGLIWAFVLVATAASQLTTQQRTIALLVGFCLRCLLVAISAMITQGDEQPMLMVVLAVVAVVMIVVSRQDTQLLETVSAAGFANVVKVNNSHTPIPFSNKLFAMIVMLACVCSFANTELTWDIVFVDGAVFSSLISFVVTVILLALHRGHTSVDTLFYLAISLVIIGFVFGILWTDALPQLQFLGISCLASAADLLMLFVFLLIFELSSRNVLSVFTLVAFAMLAFNLGLIIDFVLWSAANVIGGLVAAVFFTVFVVFSFQYLRGYSFEGAIESVKPLGDLGQIVRDATYEEACERIADRYNLTARERDVFRLLARGRSGLVIEDELVVSQNTVKTHTRNIYNKLGVHSRQELIDLVEHDGEDPKPR